MISADYRLTKEFLEIWNPCNEGMEWFKTKYPDGVGYAEIYNYLQRNGLLNWASWLFRSLGPCAEPLYLQESEYNNIRYPGTVIFKNDACVKGDLSLPWDVISNYSIVIEGDLVCKYASFGNLTAQNVYVGGDLCCTGELKCNKVVSEIALRCSEIVVEDSVKSESISAISLKAKRGYVTGDISCYNSLEIQESLFAMGNIRSRKLHVGEGIIAKTIYSPEKPNNIKAGEWVQWAE